MSFLCCVSYSPSSLEPQNRQAGQNILSLNFVIGFKKMLKKICALFPGQLPFGILREANEVTAVAEMENLVAQDDRLEPYCLGLCKLTYKVLWVVMWPVCQLVPPFGR